MEKIIEVKDVTKKFKKQTILEKVNLTVEKGSICGLIGMNGSGKTVLMKLLCGFLGADEGEIYIRGQQIGKDCDFPPNTGIIIEHPEFAGFVSGYRNLADLATLNKKADREQIRKTMNLLGLNPDDKKWVSKYSLGMKQRLGIAQAIMEGQDLLILDEPFNGLDKTGAQEIRGLFMRLRDEGTTILISSHHQEDIDILCDYVYEMDAGRLAKL